MATVRQARRAAVPDPVHAAVPAELGGADGPTVHLRSGCRHIQDRDVEILRRTVKTRLDVVMAAADEMQSIALDVKPGQVTLVPERPDRLTTEGGLDVVWHRGPVRPAVEALRRGGIGRPAHHLAGPGAARWQAGVTPGRRRSTAAEVVAPGPGVRGVGAGRCRLHASSR